MHMSLSLWIVLLTLICEVDDEVPIQGAPYIPYIV